MATFHSTNETLGAFVTSVYLLGYCFGPLVIGPLSEIYGRAIVYNVCNTIFLIFSIACAVANNLGALIAFRFFAGIGASCPLTLGPGTIADIIAFEKRGLAMMCWIMGPIVGPTFGPLGWHCPQGSLEDVGLTTSSWWLPSSGQRLALDLLARLYRGKFQTSSARALFLT
jgi:MFS family permease